MTPCDRHNLIKVRKKDGTQLTVIRCADPGCARFTQDVTEEQCHQCPRFAEVALANAALAIRSGGVVPSMPSFPHRAMTWVEAVAGWVLAGRPERPDEEVQHIYHTFCADTPPCGWYDSDSQVCKGCGCNVKAYGHAVFNKIKMSTQHCPQGLW